MGGSIILIIWMFTVRIELLVDYKQSPGGGAVVSWLVRCTPDRAIRVRALAAVTALCSLGKILYSHSASLSTQVCK